MIAPVAAQSTTRIEITPQSMISPKRVVGSNAVSISDDCGVHPGFQLKSSSSLFSFMIFKTLNGWVGRLTCGRLLKLNSGYTLLNQIGNVNKNYKELLIPI